MLDEFIDRDIINVDDWRVPKLRASAAHTSVLIKSLFTQPPITLLEITAKLIIEQLCNVHIIST